MYSGESALTSSSSGDRVGYGKGLRSWSAPACSVRHMRDRLATDVAVTPQSGEPDRAAVTASHKVGLRHLGAQQLVKNPRLDVSNIRRLGYTSRVTHRPCFVYVSAGSSTGEEATVKLPTSLLTQPDSPDLNHETTNAILQETSHPVSTEGRDVDAVRAKLDNATSQISLLNAANEQTRRGYAILEEENTQLHANVCELRQENKRLRNEIARRDEEIDEQLHLICDLQRQLAAFMELVDQPPSL